MKIMKTAAAAVMMAVFIIFFGGEPGLSAMAAESPIESGFREIDGDWYYFFEDGSINKEELFLDNAVYEFTENGALKSARWQDNTGGGAYPAGCYDEETQALFDEMNEKKRELYFEEYPEREDGFDTDLPVYDKDAGFEMDMELNRAAAHRLSAAKESRYSDGKIPDEGTAGDYLAAVSGRKHATCLEVYIKSCDGADEAFERLLKETEDRYEIRGDRLRSLEYYRSVGIAHEETDGRHAFLILFLR